jgi:uncharacterized membrane protein
MRFAKLTIAIAVLLCVLPGWAKSYRHPLIEQTYRLNADGSADVEELRVFQFFGSYSKAFIERSTKGEYGEYDIDFIAVLDAETGQEVEWAPTAREDFRGVQWSYRAQDERKRFLIRYRIRRAVQRYGDVAQMYWKAIEDEHETIDSLRVKVLPPYQSPEIFKLFVHSRAKPGELYFSPALDTAIFTMRNIPTTSFVEFRALLDPSLFPDAKLRKGESRQSLLDAEYRIGHPTFWDRFKFLKEFAIPLALLGLALLVIIALYFIYGKEPRVPDAKEYERELPRELPPCVVSAIMTQSEVEMENIGQGFSATLLEAGRQGYLTIEADEKTKDMTFSLTEKGDELLKGKQTPQKDRALEDSEIHVLKKCFRDAGSGATCTSADLRTWAKQDVGGMSQFRAMARPWGENNRQWFEQKYFKLDEPDSESVKFNFPIITGVLLFIIFGYYSLTHGTVSIPLILILVGTFFLSRVIAKTMARRTQRGAREVQRWKAFGKFLTDFSELEKARADLITMWDKYLVYATALGIADKLHENLRLLERQYDMQYQPTLWYGYDGHYHGAMLAGHSLSFAELQSNMSDLFTDISSYMPQSASYSGGAFSDGGGGGGFSGGGGGGGGGGSSGAS